MPWIQTKYRILKTSSCMSPKWGDTFELGRVSASASCIYTIGWRKSHLFPFGMDFTLWLWQDDEKAQVVWALELRLVSLCTPNLWLCRCFTVSSAPRMKTAQLGSRQATVFSWFHKKSWIPYFQRAESHLHSRAITSLLLLVQCRGCLKFG